MRSFPRGAQPSPGATGSANRDPRAAAQLSPAEPDTATDPRAAWRPPAGPDSANAVAGPAPASGSSTSVKAALPVQIRFRHINDVIQAGVVNVSNEEISVDVSILQSGAQTTLDLSPGIPVFFGVRDGLELHAADQVTLRGASYRDLVTTVR